MDAIFFPNEIIVFVQVGFKSKIDIPIKYYFPYRHCLFLAVYLVFRKFTDFWLLICLKLC